MNALLALASPFLPYIFAAIVALVGGGGYVWNAKRKARNEGISEQKAKEAAANAKDIDIIQRASGARPVGTVAEDPYNRDNR